MAKGSRSLASFLFRLDRAQDRRAPFVAAFIHELLSEGRHHHLGGLVLGRRPEVIEPWSFHSRSPRI
jgi:hypothetical protein